MHGEGRGADAVEVGQEGVDRGRAKPASKSTRSRMSERAVRRLLAAVTLVSGITYGRSWSSSSKNLYCTARGRLLLCFLYTLPSWKVINASRSGGEVKGEGGIPPAIAKGRGGQ